MIGAGQMGQGIAEVCALAGKKIALVDSSSAALHSAKDFIERRLEKSLEKGKITSELLLKIRASLSYTSFEDLGEIDIAKVDLCIEAIVEDAEAKKCLFRDLDARCPDKTIFASNTSSISITELASATERSDRFMGMHFMNPVPVMPLVEGIRGHASSDDTADAISKLAGELGKTYVVSRDFPGFIVNRILMPMINEAFFALYENIASADDVDRAMKLGTNVPMGPLTLADFIGLDTCLSIMEVLHQGFGDSKYRPCPLLRQYVLAGRLGKKSGHGVYAYLV